MKAIAFILIAILSSCEQPIGPENISPSDPGVTHGTVEYSPREKPE